MDAFIAGLNDQIATKILEMFLGPQSLYALQTIAARLDSRLSTRRQFFIPQNHSNNNNNNNRRHPPKGKPKFNIHSSLLKEEKDRRRKENHCMYCGSSEHSLNSCPLRNKFKSSSSNVHISNPEPTTIPRSRISDLPNVKLPIYEFTIKVNNSKTKTKILFDSGSQLNLIDVYFVKEYNIPYSTQSNSPRVTGIGGKQQILGKISPVSIQYENRICKTQFYVVDLSSYCAILGTEWLFTHNPTIDFTSNKLFFKSNHCIANCLVIPSSFTASICTEEYNSNKNEEHNETNNNIQKTLPAKLFPFKYVFDEKSANELPENFYAITSFVSSLNDQILNECKNDEFYSDFCNELNSDDSNNSRLKNFSISNSFLLFKNKIYVPPKCRSTVLNICHDSPSAGHYGIKKTSSLIYRDFW